MERGINEVSHEDTRLSVEELKTILQSQEEENQLLKAEISQLEAFQLDCDKEATHLHNMAEFSKDVGIYRLRLDIDNPERSRILYMNSAAKKIMGVPNPMDHNSWFVDCHPDDLQTAIERQIESLETGIFRLDVRLFQNDDGFWHWVRLYSFIAPNEKGEKDIFNGFVWDITTEKHAQQEAEQKSKSLRRLSYQLFQEDERYRQSIADILHGKVGQSLSLLRLTLARETRAASDGSVLPQCLGILDQIIEDTRTLTTEIYPTILHKAGLVETLRWLCSTVSDLMSISVQFESDAKYSKFDNDIEIFLYRAAAELLTNSMKYSGADQVSLSLLEEEKALCLQVIDNGLGFQSDQKHQYGSGGFGLFSIQEKLNHLDGRLDINTKQGKGTDISVYIPL